MGSNWPAAPPKCKGTNCTNRERRFWTASGDMRLDASWEEDEDEAGLEGEMKTTGNVNVMWFCIGGGGAPASAPLVDDG